MTFGEAYWKVVRSTRILSLLAAFFIVVFLILNLADNAWYLIYAYPHPRFYSLWRETVPGVVFAVLLTVAFLARFTFIVSGSRTSLIRAQLLWIVPWGILLGWAVFTHWTSASAVFAPPIKCYDCVDAFLGVPWRNPLTHLLVFYFSFSPIRQLANPVFAWFWKQAETYS